MSTYTIIAGTDADGTRVAIHGTDEQDARDSLWIFDGEDGDTITIDTVETITDVRGGVGRNAAVTSSLWWDELQSDGTLVRVCRTF